ncbi:hypothetical protein ACIQJT_34980 [Streptomyces sp. NPDC091972]|uniref:hypothetical protein n=1 Tax=Streptomyces sp. NPDC091972 TaxID=3366007 RepID=UPI00381B8DC7
MTYAVNLEFDVEKALATLSDDDQREVMELIAAALVAPDSWPALGGWDGVLRSGPRMWIMFTAYLDGIDVVAIGVSGDPVPGLVASLRLTARLHDGDAT